MACYLFLFFLFFILIWLICSCCLFLKPLHFHKLLLVNVSKIPNELISFLFGEHSNADRVSWWELTVLASHVHPSVATMARTLLSGANIVYNGNPLNDLSLPAFLDKLMEKKPKQSSWHGGSQIEPAKKVSHQFMFLCPCIIGSLSCFPSVRDRLTFLWVATAYFGTL